MKIGVVGAGAFGTALGNVLAHGGHSVTLFGRDKNNISEMRRTGLNTRYLPDIALSAELSFTNSTDDLTNSEVILCAVPAQKTRDVLKTLTSGQAPILMCAKGLETKSGLLQTDIGKSILPQRVFGVISGPSFANEIAEGKPTALTISTEKQSLTEYYQSELSTPSLRLYASFDLAGLQFCGALKNVYAIGCGLIMGAGLGESARAAAITRSFVEFSRIAQKLGTAPETLAGLSGLGDLVLTCTSEQSRNYSFGRELAQSGITETANTVEGRATATALLALASKHGVDMPMAGAIGDVLSGSLTVKDALYDLMGRPLKAEQHH